MNIKKSDRGEFRGLRELKVLKGRKRVEYIWNYYKLAIGLFFLAIYLIIYMLFRHMTATVPYMYLGYVNVSAGEDLASALTDDFLSTQAEADSRSCIYTYNDLILSESLSGDDVSYLYASQMKILAAIDAEELDVVLMNKEAFDAFAQNGYLINIDNFLKSYAPSLCDSLSPYIESNLEILEDNASELRFDSSLTYESVTTEYPMGIRVNDLPVFASAGFSDDVYLGIIANAARPEAVSEFLLYISL